VRSVFPSAPAGAAQLHPGGAIRCPWGFHSVLTDEYDQAEFRIQVLVPGDQLARLPVEAVGGAVRDALTGAGIGIGEFRAVVLPPAHDCAALMEVHK
jgi:hypothetical protein